MTERVGAIVPAAGRSTRMAGVDKLFVPLEGRPLLSWCVETLERCPLVARIVVAVASAQIPDVERMGCERGWTKTAFVPGGVRRQDSVARALSSLGDADWVVVHDGDRPFLNQSLIAEGLRAARETGAAVACVPVKDTVKMVDDDGAVVTTLDRGRLRAVQTPQVFRADVIRRAYSDIEQTVTDDAMLAESLGYVVRLYEGAYENLKVTTPDDLLIAQAIGRRWSEPT